MKKISVSATVIVLLLFLVLFPVHGMNGYKAYLYGMDFAEAREFDTHKDDIAELADFLLKKFQELKQQYPDLHSFDAQGNGDSKIEIAQLKNAGNEMINDEKVTVALNERLNSCFRSVCTALWRGYKHFAFARVYKNEVHFVSGKSMPPYALIYSKNPLFVENEMEWIHSDKFITERLGWRWYQRVWD